MFLSLDDRKGEIHWKTTVILTRPFEGPVAQRTKRLTTNQEIAGPIFSKVGDRLFTPTFSVFGETKQDYPVCRQTPDKNFAATKRIDQTARTFTLLRI